MEDSVAEVNRNERRRVLREISVPDSESQRNIAISDASPPWQPRRRSLGPRPRVTYADLSPINRRMPSPQLPTGSFTFEPNEPEKQRKPRTDMESQLATCIIDFNFETPPKTPRSTHKSPTKRPMDTPTSMTAIPFTILSLDDSPNLPVPAKKPRLMLLGDQASLGQQLASLTNDQLVEVVDKLVEKYPEMYKEVLTLLPEPDLTQCQDRLSDLLHNIFRALPRTRLASTRGALSYRQVKVHLLEFKKYCLQQGRHFVNCQAWSALINYVLLAWQLVNYLPVWENPAHNIIRSQCLRSLVMFGSKALKNAHLDSESLATLRLGLVKACRLNAMMHPCLDIVRSKLENNV